MFFSLKKKNNNLLFAFRDILSTLGLTSMLKVQKAIQDYFFFRTICRSYQKLLIKSVWHYWLLFNIRLSYCWIWKYFIVFWHQCLVFLQVQNYALNTIQYKRCAFTYIELTVKSVLLSFYSILLITPLLLWH